jgi:Na+-transporting methylmalonyl-CoA/oxaloacetate decarboxylase gamma subunit
MDATAATYVSVLLLVFGVVFLVIFLAMLVPLGREVGRSARMQAESDRRHQYDTRGPVAKRLCDETEAQWLLRDQAQHVANAKRLASWEAKVRLFGLRWI